MPTIKVPIEDDAGLLIATVRWIGDFYRGEALVFPEKGHGKIKTQIESLPMLRDELYSVWFTSCGTRTRVRGWSGLEGVLGALRVTLPALGLRVGYVEKWIDG